MKFETRKLTAIAMLCTLAWTITAVGRIPIVLFLKYDPKDIIITIGGFIFGPLSALAVTVVVAFLEMFTLSETGIIGFIMNIISGAAFACTASFIYKKKRSLAGAVTGLVMGCIAMTSIMLLWNYLITPLYINTSREEVAGMLLPIFLPFNLLKSGINAAAIMLLYKPLSKPLRHFALPSTSDPIEKRVNPGVIIVSLFVLISCVLIVLSIQGII